MKLSLRLLEAAARSAAPSSFLGSSSRLCGSSSASGSLQQLSSASVNLQQLRTISQDTRKGTVYTRQIRSVSLGASNEQSTAATSIPVDYPALSPRQLVEDDLSTMFQEIHHELGNELADSSQLAEMAKYYFDGNGKALRPVISLCVGHAYNAHQGTAGNEEIVKKQRLVAIISEMIHTASLIHDDVLDHAETRRGKASVNLVWDPLSCTFTGDYIIAICSKLLARTNNQDVIQLLSRVLFDLVQGELMQLQNKVDEEARFEDYITKSFNKTASLMANSCQANAVLSGISIEEAYPAFLYGKHIGIAFQLVDDLLDFVSSADQLGKPAAADLQLGLATAPVLFATKQFPELNDLINRRFSEPGDVEKAFNCAIQSGGLEETRKLARNHCNEAIDSLAHLNNSIYKSTLINLCDTVLNRLK